MSGSGRLARQRLQEVYQAAQLSASCVTPAILLRQRNQESHTTVLRFPDPAGVQLDATRRLTLLIRLWTQSAMDAVFRLDSPAIVGYFAAIGLAEHGPLLAFHWHPLGASHVVIPHLHVELRNSVIDLSKTHLPTGHVTLAAMIHMLITEFGVPPRRDDWHAVLRHADQVLATAFPTQT